MDSGKGTKMSTKDRILERLLKSEVAKDRRERIATAILGGMFATDETWNPDRATDKAKVAIQHADALIAELDREGKC